jgi:hypothetical protein
LTDLIERGLNPDRAILVVDYNRLFGWFVRVVQHPRRHFESWILDPGLRADSTLDVHCARSSPP